MKKLLLILFVVWACSSEDEEPRDPNINCEAFKAQWDKVKANYIDWRDNHKDDPTYQDSLQYKKTAAENWEREYKKACD